MTKIWGMVSTRGEERVARGGLLDLLAGVPALEKRKVRRLLDRLKRHRHENGGSPKGKQ